MYVRLGLQNVIREQWWVPLLCLLMATSTFFLHVTWPIVIVGLALIAYVIFWIVQFYGITLLEQNQILFGRLYYEISGQHISMQISAKRGMPIPWTQIKRAISGRSYFLLVVSKAHLIYLPHSVFNGVHEIHYLTTTLKRKGLL